MSSIFRKPSRSRRAQYQPQFLSVHLSVTVEPYFAVASTKESSALRNSRTGMKKDLSPLSQQQRSLCLDGTDNSLTLNTRKPHFGHGISASSNRLVIKDDFVYASIVLSSFPSSNSGYGPFSIKINEMPEDVDAIVPICLRSGSYTKGQVGSRLGQARIQCGHISMNLNEEASNIGGQGSFFIFFAPRHQFKPRVPGVGKKTLATDDVTCGKKTSMESLMLGIGDELGLCHLELKFTQFKSYEGISFYLKEYPNYAKYSMEMPVLSRGSNSTTDYIVAPQMVSFSEFNKFISLHNLGRSITNETNIFDTSIISDIVTVNSLI